MNEIIITLLVGVFALQLIAYTMCQLELRNLKDKQQSTIYGVSHLWGSMMELKEEMKKVTEKTEEITSEEEIDEVVE